MQKEIRTVCYDKNLRLEAYRFEGIVQPFPNHFHDYYVIGFIEAGARCLSCKNKEYTIGQGNILLFNPKDNHSCVQCDGKTLDYRGLNIPKETMLSLAEEITGSRTLPGFSENVIKNDELNRYLHSLHQMIMDGSKDFEKEETFLTLISLLIEKYGQDFSSCASEQDKKIEDTCAFMAEHITEHITLENLCKHSNMSKSTLLRAFIKSKRLTPYRYLQTIRIGKAAVYSLLTRKISSYGYNTIQTTRRIFTYGILFMLPFLFIFDFSLDFQKMAEPEYALNLIFLGLGASALCFVTWSYAVKVLGAVETSVYIYMVPVITVVTSVAVLGEEITWMAAIGTGLTLIGLFLSESKFIFKERGKQNGRRE